MKKTAFIFPGQGSQYVGMGKDFYDTFACSREIVELAACVSGIDIKKLLFEENEKINETRYTQIAMLADELAIWAAVCKEGVSSSVNAGLSLGEYAALVASGALSTGDAFSLIKKRGELMQNEYPTGGGMTAVMGADIALIEKICRETEGTVAVANYNCPGQTVISGEKAACDKVAKALREAGVKRCIPLTVSGPFHSPLLKGAGDKLSAELENIEIHDIKIPYITNVTAEYVSDKAQVKDLLRRQVSSPVMWQQSVERMLADGVEVFIEIGPKRSLSGFMKKIDTEKKAVSLHVDKVSDLEKLKEELNG